MLRTARHHLHRLTNCAALLPPIPHTPHTPPPPHTQAARALDEDVMSQVPAEFDPKFKNPCWEKDGKLQCLPYFYVAGGFQSGAWDLWSRLAQHPMVPTAHNVRWAAAQGSGLRAVAEGSRCCW